jgi:hypothetical protein
MASKARKLKAHQAKIFNTVENSTILLDLLETSISSARKTIFIQALIRSLPTAFDRFDKEPHLYFDIFTTWFGNYQQSTIHFSRINAALQHRQQYFLETRFKKRQFISDIGLDWTPDDKVTFFSKVNFFLCWC